MDILFASSNSHKKQELESLLYPHLLHLPSEYGLSFDCSENGSTFIENAMQKAFALFEAKEKINIDIPVLADDSGLLVDALPGELGVRTARYGSPDGITLLSQAQKNSLLLNALKGLSVKERTACFACALVLVKDRNSIYCVQEYAPGYILNHETGTNGFGYDPIFFSSEANSPFALLSTSEKNKYSHRGKAASKLLKLVD